MMAEWKNLRNRKKKWKSQFRVKGGDTRQNSYQKYVWLRNSLERYTEEILLYESNGEEKGNSANLFQDETTCETSEAQKLVGWTSNGSFKSRRLFLSYPLLQGSGFNDPERSIQCTLLIAGVPPYCLILDYAKDHTELPSQGFALSLHTPTEIAAISPGHTTLINPPPSCSLTIKAGYTADKASLLVSLYSHS